MTDILREISQKFKETRQAIYDRVKESIEFTGGSGVGTVGGVYDGR